MIELIKGITIALVDKPEAVTVKALGEPDGHGTLIQLTVDPSDVGKVIGKQGGTARAIRLLLSVAGVKSGHRWTLDIVEVTK